MTMRISFPDWRKPSGLPPGQPWPGFLREMRQAYKTRDHIRRERIRNERRARKP